MWGGRKSQGTSFQCFKGGPPTNGNQQNGMMILKLVALEMVMLWMLFGDDGNQENLPPPHLVQSPGWRLKVRSPRPLHPRGTAVLYQFFGRNRGGGVVW